MATKQREHKELFRISSIAIVCAKNKEEAVAIFLDDLTNGRGVMSIELIRKGGRKKWT